MIRVGSLARALVFRICLYINQLFVMSHVKQLSMWLVIVLLSGVYTFSQFPLLLLVLKTGLHPLSYHTFTHSHTFHLFAYSPKQLNDWVLFRLFIFECPPTQMSCWRFMLAFRVVFLLYLFIFVAGSAAAAGCNRRSEDPNTFAAYAFLYAIYVCVPASLCPFLFISFSFLFVCLVFVRFVELPALNQLCFGGIV